VVFQLDDPLATPPPLPPRMSQGGKYLQAKDGTVDSYVVFQLGDPCSVNIPPPP